MKLEVKDNCPLEQLRAMRQFDCAWFMKVQGTTPTLANPQRSGDALWRGYRS